MPDPNLRHASITTPILADRCPTSPVSRPAERIPVVVVGGKSGGVLRRE